VITITLHFKTHYAALAALAAIPGTDLVGSPEPEPAPAPKAAKAAKAAPAPVAQPEPAQAAEPAAPAAEPAPATIEYAVLQKAVFALAGKSRDAAAAVAQSFGVKTFKELDPTKWADALEAVNERIAIIEAN
jgi:hypothetical protein